MCFKLKLMTDDERKFYKDYQKNFSFELPYSNWLSVAASNMQILLRISSRDLMISAFLHNSFWSVLSHMLQMIWFLISSSLC